MLTLKFDDGETEVSDTSLIIFIDETGHEEMLDHKFPVFGFGGCICTAKNYLSAVHDPWETVESHFPSQFKPLHATDLRLEDMTSERIEAVSSFFRNQPFGRFACIITSAATYSIDTPTFHTLARATYARIIEIAQWLQFDNVVMIFEDSERTNKLMADYFSRYEFSEDRAEIPIQRLKSPKETGLSGLTVADFIVHTAGTSVNSRLKGVIAQNGDRRDFQSIFMTSDPKLASFMEITDVSSKT